MIGYKFSKLKMPSPTLKKKKDIIFKMDSSQYESVFSAASVCML